MIAHYAGMKRGLVTYSNPLTHDRWRALHRVDNGSILDVAARADANGLNIAAQDALKPHAGIGRKLDFANHIGAGGDVHPLANSGSPPRQGVEIGSVHKGSALKPNDCHCIS